MASHEVHESAYDEQWGFGEIERLLGELDTLPDHSAVAIEAGSLFDVDFHIQNYDAASDQVLFLIGVATDHLNTFQRMMVDPNGGLPAMAGYTLLRAAIEAAATALWLRLPGTANARIGRSLWLIVNNRTETEGLAGRLHIANPAGNDRMRARVDAIIEGRRGLTPGMLDRKYKKTTILNVVSQRIPGRVLTPLEAWQACSGLTHSNRTSALMFLERTEVETVGTRTLYSVTASARITAEMLWITVECLKAASDRFMEHARSEHS